METQNDSINKFQNHLGWKHQAYRLLWSWVWAVFARPLPRSMGCGWKRFLLRLFGAKIDNTAVVYSTARIYYPANLTMGPNSCLDNNVNCYNVDMVTLGKNVTVSQGAFLCPGSHDIYTHKHTLITAPITICDNAWVAVNALIGMGVTIGEGAVVGAGACVFKDVEPWMIVGGNPAKVLKTRKMRD